MQAIAIIAALVALTWGTFCVIRGSLLGGCFAYLVIACCFGGEFYSFDAVGLTWSLDRFYLVGLFIAYLVQWRLGRLQHRPMTWGDALLGGFILVLIGNTFMHDWRNNIPDQVPIIMHLVNGYLIPVSIFWIARHAPVQEKNVTFVHWGLVVFGIYLVVTALLEIGGQWSLVFPRYIADPELGIHFGRARGPMLQSARFGVYLIVCLSATWLALAWQARLGSWGRLLAVVSFPLYAAAIYYTYTRSVWLGAGLAVFLIAAFTLRGRTRPFVLASMMIAVLIVGIVKRDQLIAFKREYTAAETRESTYMRASFTYVSWQMFKEKPLLGYGFGQFTREAKPFLGDRSTSLQLESIRGYVHHNTLLCVLVELGLLGLLFYLATLLYWVRIGWKIWRDPRSAVWIKAHSLLMLTAFAAHLFQLIFRDVSFSPVENTLIFLLAGTAMNLRAKLTETNRAHIATTDTTPNAPRLWDWFKWRPSNN